MRSLQDALDASDGPLDLLSSIDPHADSDHLRLFEDLPSAVTNWREQQQA